MYPLNASPTTAMTIVCFWFLSYLDNY